MYYYALTLLLSALLKKAHPITKAQPQIMHSGYPPWNASLTGDDSVSALSSPISNCCGDLFSLSWLQQCQLCHRYPLKRPWQMLFSDEGSAADAAEDIYKATRSLKKPPSRTTASHVPVTTNVIIEMPKLLLVPVMPHCYPPRQWPFRSDHC